MAISDQDLLMLENLTYMLGDNTITNKNGLKSIADCRTVGEYLNQFSDELLSKLDKQKDNKYDGDISGREWAAMIRYLKQKKEIIQLKIKDVTNKVICFEDSSKNAIVAFRGTKGGSEWKDNVEGLNQADTKYQLEAYEYIENLPYEHVTVIGHSKGGNKAQYVAIRCNKVDRCVSCDGQGFSKEFIEKYSVEIQKNSHKITCYSLATDFVNILMYYLPGVKQIYIRGGDDVNGITENHSPNSVFDYYVDKDGKYQIKVEKKGNAYLNIGQQNSSMKELHKFITFFMNNASESEKRQITDLLGPLLKGIYGEQWGSEEIAKYLLEHQEEMTTFIAYLLKYMKLNDLKCEDIIKISDTLGIDLCQVISDMIYEKKGVRISKKNIEKIIDYIINNITDKDRDTITKWIINRIVGKKAGQEIAAWWDIIQDKYNNLKVKNDSKEYTVKIRDYSKKIYNAINGAISYYSKNSQVNVSSWNSFSGENWFSKLLVYIAVKCINSYSDKIISINKLCKKRVDETFNNIIKVDQSNSREILKITKNVTKICGQVKS